MEMLWGQFRASQEEIGRWAIDLRLRIASFVAQFNEHASELRECDVSLAQMVERMKKSYETEDRNPGMGQVVLSRILSYFRELEGIFERWESLSRLPKLEIAGLLYLTAKLESLMDWMLYALHVPRDDLFSVPSTDPRWNRIRELTTITTPERPEELEDGIRLIEEGVLYANAVINKGFQHQHPTTKEIVIGASAVLYHIAPKRIKAQAMINYARPSVESTLALWNATDSALIAPMYERGLMKVAIQAMIYIPRTADPVLPYVGSVPASRGKSPRFHFRAKE